MKRSLKGSITRIESRLTVPEVDSDHPNACDSARQMLAKLKEHDANLTLIDLMEDDETLIAEQATLYEHDDLVAAFTVCIMKLTDSTTTSTREVSACEYLACRCDCLESHLTETATASPSLTHEDVCELQQYQEQSLDYKRERAEISNTLLSLTLKESDIMPSRIKSLKKQLFDCSLRLKELSHSGTTSSSLSHPDPKGVKFAKTRCFPIQR